MYLTRIRLNEMGRDMFEVYKDFPKVKIMNGVERVDPFIVAENILKLTVDFHHLSLNGSTFGLTAYNKTLSPIFDKVGTTELYKLDGETILIEEELLNHPIRGKLNFTVMHEACHHILRKMYPKDYGPQSNDECQLVYYTPNSDKKKKDWDEWQATVLAASILMPEELLLENMKKVGLGDKVEIFSKECHPAFDKLCQLAEIMGVSVQALRIRMDTLGLIEFNEFGNVRKCIDIYAD